MMHEHRFELRERDGIRLAARKWTASKTVHAVLVIAHGMGEHSGRYAEPLTQIAEAGVAIYALDHRGHGLSVQEGGTLGDYGPGGYMGVVSDLSALIERARIECPDMPLVLFGHSMGSMIAQGYVLEGSRRIDGLILCGSVAVDVVARAASEDPAIFAAMNSPFDPGRTGFEWLSRDEKEVDRYVADPKCGFALIPESFGDLLANAARLADPTLLGNIRTDLPMLIVSGDNDPLVLILDGLNPLVERYRNAGLKPTFKLFPGARHEILNETNRQEVVDYLQDWIESVVDNR